MDLELKKVPTCQLVEELRSREGVRVTTISPYKDKKVLVNGPAIVLVITD